MENTIINSNELLDFSNIDIVNEKDVIKKYFELCQKRNNGENIDSELEPLKENENIKNLEDLRNKETNGEVKEGTFKKNYNNFAIKVTELAANYYNQLSGKNIDNDDEIENNSNKELSFDLQNEYQIYVQYFELCQRRNNGEDVKEAIEALMNQNLNVKVLEDMRMNEENGNLPLGTYRTNFNNFAIRITEEASRIASERTNKNEETEETEDEIFDDLSNVFSGGSEDIAEIPDEEPNEEVVEEQEFTEESNENSEENNNESYEENNDEEVQENNEENNENVEEIEENNNEEENSEDVTEQEIPGEVANFVDIPIIDIPDIDLENEKDVLVKYFELCSRRNEGEDVSEEIASLTEKNETIKMIEDLKLKEDNGLVPFGTFRINYNNFAIKVSNEAKIYKEEHQPPKDVIDSLIEDGDKEEIELLDDNDKNEIFKHIDEKFDDLKWYIDAKISELRPSMEVEEPTYREYPIDFSNNTKDLMRYCALLKAENERELTEEEINEKNVIASNNEDIKIVNGAKEMFENGNLSEEAYIKLRNYLYNTLSENILSDIIPKKEEFVNKKSL